MSHMPHICNVCMYVWTYVCVCEWVRERERERESASLSEWNRENMHTGISDLILVLQWETFWTKCRECKNRPYPHLELLAVRNGCGLGFMFVTCDVYTCHSHYLNNNNNSNNNNNRWWWLLGLGLYERWLSCLFFSSAFLQCLVVIWLTIHCMCWQPVSFLLVCRIQQIPFINFVLFHFSYNDIWYFVIV